MDYKLIQAKSLKPGMHIANIGVVTHVQHGNYTARVKMAKTGEEQTDYPNLQPVVIVTYGTARDIPPEPWATSKWQRVLPAYLPDPGGFNHAGWGGIDVEEDSSGNWQWAAYVGNGVSEYPDGKKYATATSAAAAGDAWMAKYPNMREWDQWQREEWVVRHTNNPDMFWCENDSGRARVWIKDEDRAVKFTGQEKCEFTGRLPVGGEWFLSFTRP